LGVVALTCVPHQNQTFVVDQNRSARDRIPASAFD